LSDSDYCASLPNNLLIRGLETVKTVIIMLIYEVLLANNWLRQYLSHSAAGLATMHKRSHALAVVICLTIIINCLIARVQSLCVKRIETSMLNDVILLVMDSIVHCNCAVAC
jgi:hypothetical protein